MDVLGSANQAYRGQEQHVPREGVGLMSCGHNISDVAEVRVAPMVGRPMVVAYGDCAAHSLLLE